MTTSLAITITPIRVADLHVEGEVMPVYVHLIDHPDGRVLVDTGLTELHPAVADMDPRLMPLTEHDVDLAGIDIVVNTHLHFDHAGGNTIGPNAAPQFPNARYLVSASELEHANDPHERDRASYLSENWEPMQQSGQLETMPDDYEVVPGLKMQTIRGHSETVQTWRLDRGGQPMYGFADLIPTRHHVPLPWIMGYDLYPTETLAFKKEALPKAVNEGWLCLFYHDLDHPICKLTVVDGKIVASDSHH